MKTDETTDGDSGTGTGVNPNGVDPLPPLSEDVALPIVFVHGFAGSAQQYQSQAMRFVANGYPQERIFAYDHDGQGVDTAAYVTGADAVVETALAQFNVDKVYLVGHSRGTAVSALYLGDPARAAKIAKYVSLDGAGCAASDTAGVPCIAPHQNRDADDDAAHGIPGQAHVEVATSKESFAMQYEHFVGSPPAVVDIVAQRAPIEISGRAVNFPQNTGRDGTTLEIWEVDGSNGKRLTTEPLLSVALGRDGAFGPVTLKHDAYYEKVLSTPGGTSQHFYAQPYLRSSHFVRLLSGPPDAPSRVNSNVTGNHANIIALRMREWYTVDDADKAGDESDILEIKTTRPGGNQPALNAMVSRIANGTIAIHIHDDAATPGESTLEGLPYFSGPPPQPFQNGVDLFMPAADPPDGTITVTNIPRGDTGNPQVLNFPNWASSGHTLMPMFSDFAPAQD